MVRLRLFRILVPALFALAGIALWWSWVPKSPVEQAVPDALPREGPRYEGVSIKKVDGEEVRIAGDAEVFEPGAEDSLHLEGIRNLEIPRSARGPIFVRAERGDRVGAAGARRWSFGGEVVSELRDEGLVLRLPALEIDQAEDIARSEGKIELEGTGLRGTTTRLSYGIEGKTGELGAIDFEEESGGRLTAERAILHDGIEDIELVGSVRMVQPGRELSADRIRLVRPGGRLRQATATGSVSGRWETAAAAATLRGERLDLFLDPEGQLERFRLEGRSRLQHGERVLEARLVDASRREEGWEVAARDEVRLRGELAGDRGLLVAESLDLVLDGAHALRRAEARGKASLEGQGVRAQADRATFDAADVLGSVLLEGIEGYPARLSRDRTRVVARSIRTDPRGEDLLAEGRVEATLLGAGAAGAIRRLFLPDESIHFVSDRLLSEKQGNRLTFTGGVRGWQGERNLSGDRLIVDHGQETLEATGNVTSRLPRGSASALLAETDFVQVRADELRYENRAGRARYAGGVRLSFAEGWLEAEQMEIDLAEERRIHEIRASGKTRLEIVPDPDEPGAPLAGSADRLVYSPRESIVRLFGDQTPAMVRRPGQGGGTTTGRVLRYLLSTKALEVEAGDLGTARIRTSGT